MDSLLKTTIVLNSAELASAWDGVADAIEYDPMRSIRYGKCFSYFTDFVPELRLLEVGCGEGTGLLFFNKIGYRNLAGCEISAERLRRARSKLSTQISLEPVDGTGALPFETAAFDGAYSTAVIEHTTDPVGFMKEISRVVRPGGMVVISSDCWQWRILQTLGIYQSAQPIDRAMTTSELLRIFQATGFEVLHFDGFALPSEEFRFLRMLASWTWRNPLSVRVINRLRRIVKWKAPSIAQSSHARSLEREYQVFMQTAQRKPSRKPYAVRYLKSMFSDENVFHLRRK